ncbi:MAG TPA: NADH-quinone oxidoreductase subunit H, partial [Patescibacteria group bacterium]|nr:NADH-quinone oxidoreductase subunit H [Patescibacteria group bacterium]
ALGFSAQSTNVYAIVAATLENPQLVFAVSHVFVFLALVIVSLAENARIPVDNPATHLELTMVHEAMILEYSGRQLALVEWASSIKLTIFFVLLANVFVPFGLAQTLDISSIAIAAATLMLKLSILIILISFWENSVAKLRLFRLPDFLGIAFILALLGLVSHFLIS